MEWAYGTRPWRAPRVGGPAAVLACVLAAVSSAGCRGVSGINTEEASGEPVTVRLLKEPLDVPAFTVTDLDGRSFSSADWRGKVVIVNFWATWCAPCRAEIPDLVALQEKYRDNLVIVGISEDEASVDVVKRFAEEHHVNYPVVMATASLREIFPGVMALPTTFVLDRDGKLAQKNVGMLNARATEASTRLLAGMTTNAVIVRVDLKEKAVGVENVAQLKSIPGVDLATLSPEQRTTALLALNEEECNCGCHLTVARCRMDDPACAISLPQAKAIVEKIASAKP